jgi:hypothetical protein
MQSLPTFDAPTAVVLLVLLASAATGLIAVVAKQLRIYASHRAELALKRDLVERGLSIEEIERVIAARSSQASGR